MVYFLGDWGMGDSDCASYQHVPNIQPHNYQLLQPHHHQQQVQVQQQHNQPQRHGVSHFSHHEVPSPTITDSIVISSNLNIGSSLVTGTSLSSPTSCTITSSTIATPTSTVSLLESVASVTPSKKVADLKDFHQLHASSVVTSNLQQLSVSSTKLNSSSSLSGDKQHHQQQQHLQHNYRNHLIGESRPRSQSCIGGIGVDNNKDLIESDDEVALHPLSNQVCKQV